MFGRKKTNKLPRLPDGRKYRLVVISMILCLAAFGMAALNPVLASLMPELITAILGLNLIYNGGNVGNKWVLGKKGGIQLGAGQPPIEEPSPATNPGCHCNKPQE